MRYKTTKLWCLFQLGTKLYLVSELDLKLRTQRAAEFVSKAIPEGRFKRFDVSTNPKKFLCLSKIQKETRQVCNLFQEIVEQSFLGFRIAEGKPNRLNIIKMMTEKQAPLTYSALKLFLTRKPQLRVKSSGKFFAVSQVKQA